MLHSNKVVADGAVSGILDRPVNSRVTRNAFGMECYVQYDPDNADHFQRQSECYEEPSGEMAISGTFSVILERVLIFSVQLPWPEY